MLKARFWLCETKKKYNEATRWWGGGGYLLLVWYRDDTIERPESLLIPMQAFLSFESPQTFVCQSGRGLAGGGGGEGMRGALQERFVYTLVCVCTCAISK